MEHKPLRKSGTPAAHRCRKLVFTTVSFFFTERERERERETSYLLNSSTRCDQLRQKRTMNLDYKPGEVDGDAVVAMVSDADDVSNTSHTTAAVIVSVTSSDVRRETGLHVATLTQPFDMA